MKTTIARTDFNVFQAIHDAAVANPMTTFWAMTITLMAACYYITKV